MSNKFNDTQNVCVLGEIAGETAIKEFVESSFVNIENCYCQDINVTEISNILNAVKSFEK